MESVLCWLHCCWRT